MRLKQRNTSKRQPEQKSIELTQEQIDGLLDRVKQSLDNDDYETIKAMVESLVALSDAVNHKAANVRKLVRIIFGATTEKKKNIFSDDKKQDTESTGPTDTGDASSAEDPGDTKDAGDDRKGGAADAADPSEKERKKKKKKGHGRNGATAHTGAKREKVEHPDLKAGDQCPKCEEGKLYNPGRTGNKLRITGVAPLQSTVYETEDLRCALCGATFPAPLPEGICKKTYDSKAVSMIALLKYGTGLPFNRIENLQNNLDMPLPSSTQWDIISENERFFRPIHTEMIRQAAQGDILHNDDTVMKIINTIKQIEGGPPPHRKGTFTSGIVSVLGERKIALFFTGHKHAGENLNDVLEKREQGLATPIQMCDALSRNAPKDFKTIMVNCLTHGRRNFVDEIPCFPDECEYAIDALGKVYKHDATAKELGLSPEERLRYHQEHSGPVMDELLIWLNAQLDDKKVEPNSGLGKAILYMLNHWKELTGFLWIAGAPLDNNLCERVLKKAILHRKNSLFYKTSHGAAVGDMFISIIHNCELAKANPFNYLTQVLEHASLVEASPDQWMPWNYKDTLQALSSDLATAA